MGKEPVFNQDISTKEYYIVYFDILGYKAYFEDKENDVLELLRINIAIAEDTIKEHQKQKRRSHFFLLKI